MKKICFLFIFTLLPLTSYAFSGTAEVNGLWYVIVTKARVAELTCPNGSKYYGDIVIPPSIEYDGVVCNVTTIRQEAFYESKSLNSVVISDGITSISASAFYGCSSLLSVAIPNSVSTIGENAFYGCIGLKDIVIPNAVETISYRAFYGCTSLESVTIPASVTSISSFAFYGCSNLSSIILPDGLTSIGGSAFCGCSSLSAINLPGNLEFIGSNSFRGCKGLTEVELPKGLTSISASTFQYCDGLKSVTIPGSVTTIEREAFSGCTNLSSAVMGGDIVSFGENAFLGCKKLNDLSVIITDISTFCNNKVMGLIKNTLGCFVKLIDQDGNAVTDCVIPEGVTSIGDYAFYYCSLSSVTIPVSITSIGQFAFSYCSKMKGVYISDLAAWCCIQFHNNPLLQAHHLYLNGVEVKNLVIPEGVTSIGRLAFEYCEQFTSISIPNCVTSIGEMAFYNCSGLTSVNIPNSVTSIGTSAFQNCSSLATVSLGDRLSYIGHFAFASCGELGNFYCRTKKVCFASTVFSDSFVGYATLYVPFGSITEYREENGWGQFGHIVAIGDINCDDKVNAADIVAVVNYMNHQPLPSTYDIKRVDIDGNDDIDGSEFSNLVDLIMK